jgi:hypothetical protein
MNFTQFRKTGSTDSSSRQWRGVGIKEYIILKLVEREKRVEREDGMIFQEGRMFCTPTASRPKGVCRENRPDDLWGTNN